MDRSCRRRELKLHNSLFRWEELTPELKAYDQQTVEAIPQHLARGGYEIILPAP
jgi:hypothetical protein